MTLNDPLSNALSNIQNLERIGKKEAIVTPLSKITENVLNILKDNHYIGDIKTENTSRGRVAVVNLIGKINKVGTIKPNHAISYERYEDYEKRYLPAKGMGIIVVSTSQGIMTQEDAKKKSVGGRLIAYCY